MTAVETIYQNPQGKNEKGYIIDGKTYKDKEGTQRIGVGSVVPTQGGTYMYTGAGSVKVPGSISDDVRKGYESGRQNLENAYNAQTGAIRFATQNKIDNINSQREVANERYGDANRSAYQTYLQAANPYGAAEEQRARLGLSNSGYSETSKMKIANAYQQELAQNARQKNEYLDELDNSIREAEYQGDIQLANALAEYEKLVYKHGIDAAEAIANQDMRAYQAGVDATESMWRRQAEQRELEERRENELWERAYRLAAMKFSNSEIAEILGVSQSDLSRIANRR